MATHYPTLISCLIGSFLTSLTVLPTVLAQSDLDAAPIHYLSSESNDAVSLWLKKTLEDDKTDKAYDSRLGWLPEVLERLQIPTESQTLVFSKTSLQIRYISPENPRAIFFNDDVYVGYVPGGDLIELSAVDPQLGAVFYTVDQRNRKELEITREDHKCLTCHSSAKTRGVPGYLVRSVFPASSGHPVYALGTTTTDHTVELKERFGGWLVSAPLDLQHRGNRIVADADNRNPGPKTPTLELIVGSEKSESTIAPSLKIVTENYPTATSDLIALMILEHQSQGHNVLTAANWDVRRALDYQKVMNQALQRDENYHSESTLRRIDRAVESIVQYFLFANEATLRQSLPIDSDYCRKFQAMGPFDSQQQSLRALDGNDRLFRNPCSFLIYTDSFAQLPEVVHQKVLSRMSSILRASEATKGFEHLDQETRINLDRLLSETVKGYPAN